MNKALLTHLGSAIAGVLVLLFIPGVSKRLFHDKGTIPHLSTPPHKSTRSSARPSGDAQPSPFRNAPEEQPGKDSLEALLAIADIRIPSRPELESYLAANNHPAEGYLAAGMILQDSGLLREAVTRDSSNPHILFALASRDDFPAADRIEWARQLLEEQPRNPLASYLLASLTWDDRSKDSTLESLVKIDSRQGFQSFTSESMVALNDALRGTGCNPGGAALYATMAVDLPHLAPLLALSRNLQEHAKQAASREAALARQSNAALGSLLAGEGDLLSKLVGLSIQNNAYAGLPADGPLPLAGVEPKALQLSIEQSRNHIRELSKATEALRTSPELVEGYATRALVLGEIEALRWLNSRATSPSG